MKTAGKLINVQVVFCTLFIDVILAINFKGKVIEGTITYPDNAPSQFDDGSCLVIKLEDATLADAGSITIGHQVIMSPSKKTHKKYSIKLPDKEIGDDRMRGLVISAVLNVGWCAETGKSDEWFRPGDYLTDTVFHVDVSEVKTTHRILQGPEIKLVKG